MTTSRPQRRLHLCIALTLAWSLLATQSAAADPNALLDWSKAQATPQGSIGSAASLGPHNMAVNPPPAVGRPTVRQEQGAFAGRSVEHPSDKGPKTDALKQPGKLFAMADRAPIVVNGKPTSAGELKRAISADIAARAGPPKTVRGGARKVDLAALDVTRVATRATAAPMRNMDQPKPGAMPNWSISQLVAATPSPPQAAQIAPPSALKQSSTSADKTNSYSASRCLDQGPPKISEVGGHLKPGGKVTVWGECFGDRPGRVEIIGQFPGGKLAVAFTAWDMTSIDIEVPANVRGAADHYVAVSVVTADGKTTPAMQAQFIAARERIEIPERLWAPAASFELSSTTETLNTDTGVNRTNPAASGQVAKSLRVHPQCALDTMDALVLSGGISRISGWEQGPPNEATVTIDWVGTCTGTKTTTSYHYVVALGDDIAITSACRVAFQARAWGYCPAGIAP